MTDLPQKTVSLSTVITDVWVLRPREATWRSRRQLVAGWRHQPRSPNLEFITLCVKLCVLRGKGAQEK